MFIQNKINISTLIGGAGSEIDTSSGDILSAGTLGVESSEGTTLSATTTTE